MPIPITTQSIKELRDATSISIMQCKNALEEADGDMKKALAILKKSSSDIALKKKDRTVKDGRVMVKIKDNKALLIALHSETDFVSKSKYFTTLLEKLIEKGFAFGVVKMKEEAKNIIDIAIQKTGENIVLGEVYEVKGNILGYYTHNNKSATIVSLEGGNETLAKDIAMHITAMKPEYISENDIKEDTKKTVAEIFEKELSSIDKSNEMKKKILKGKITSYFREKTLLDQQFIKNPKINVRELLSVAKAKITEVKNYTI